ncbi:hypothetical protein EDD85DRAFT_872888, partial [Armillaria nabsnona]
TLQTLKDSDPLVSQILRGSRPLLGSDHALINDEIAKLEQMGSWYNAHLHTALENRKSVFAPIRRLPRDILLEIFHSVCDSWWQDVEEDGIERDSLDMTGPLWVLGSVCGLWRDILHTSPASWARRVLVESPFSKHAPEILQTYLEHTGEHPSQSEYGEIMTLLVQSSYRWRNVCIRTYTHHMHHLESVSHFPLLQTIEIDILDKNNCPANVSSDMCLKAPQLWQATLHSQGIDQSSYQHSQLPFPSYRSIRTCHIPSRESVRLTDAAPVFVSDRRHRPASPPFLRRSGCRLESLSMCADIPSDLISNIFSSQACFYDLPPQTRNSVRIGMAISEILAPSSILPNLPPSCPLLLSLGQLKMIETSFEKGSYTRLTLWKKISELSLGDNVEMRVEEWSPLYLGLSVLIFGPRIARSLGNFPSSWK